MDIRTEIFNEIKSFVLNANRHPRTAFLNIEKYKELEQNLQIRGEYQQLMYNDNVIFKFQGVTMIPIYENTEKIFFTDESFEN